MTTVAVGNDGELGDEFELNRIQPPADGVNVLSVGACDTSTGEFSRASYSCLGPGRAPGIVKPDGVAFGGTKSRPYFVLSSQPAPSARGVSGTSVAAPHALRSGIAVRAQLGESLAPLAIRALLIHRAEENLAIDRREIGWGRFMDNYSDLVTCEDNESLVIYQGELPVGNYLRAPIPLPKNGLRGMVELSATLLIATAVDPEHAGAYTQRGVLVRFRPHCENFRHYDDGSVSEHPKTEGFFSSNNMYAASEFELQEQGEKWEPCLRARRSKRSSKLLNPCFDISYQHRDGLTKELQPEPIRYALVATVLAKKVPDLYNRIVREYAQVLVPLRPKLRIPLRIS